jgi:hypothetical protein
MLPLRRVVSLLPTRQFVIRQPRVAVFPKPRYYSASLPIGEYHRLADETMDKLTTELETLLEESELPDSDVEYSVIIVALRDI